MFVIVPAVRDAFPQTVPRVVAVGAAAVDLVRRST